MTLSGDQQMTADVGPRTLSYALFERAELARAQAMVNHANLVRSVTRAKALDIGYYEDLRGAARNVNQAGHAGQAGHAAQAGHAGPAVDEARLQELQDTVDGLTKRLETQAPIEQAKGIIIAQNHCDAERAFEILRRASQRSNTKLRTVAEELVARTSGLAPHR